MGIMVLWVATCCTLILSMLAMFVASPIPAVILLALAIVTSILIAVKAHKIVYSVCYALCALVCLYQLYQFFYAVVNVHTTTS